MPAEDAAAVDTREAFVDFSRDAPDTVRLLTARYAAAAAPPAKSAQVDEELARVAAALCGARACFYGPYELVAPIGVGGVATVYRARHVHPAFADRATAVKVLQQAHRGDGRLLHLFRREADVLSLIRHANVVETYDAGTQDDVAYLGMEYVPGADLSHLLWRARHRQVTLPVPLLVYIATEVAAGLAYAHGLQDLHERPLNLVHRDVNPANVLLGYDGAVKLSDFGVASVRLDGAVQATELAGKAGYFAPEQLDGEPARPTGDVYALGATLYEMLAGAPLYGAGSPAEVLQRNRVGALPPKMLEAHDPKLVAVVQSALARAPEDRYASAAALSASLLPFTPDAGHARLLLGALMRQLFAVELRAERALADALAYRTDAGAARAARGAKAPAPARAGLPGPPAASVLVGASEARVGEGNLSRSVDVVVHDPLARGATLQVLGQAGYETHAFADLVTWQRERTGLHPPSPVAVVDARLADAATHRACAQEMALRVRHLQVLTLAGAFDLAAAEVAAIWRARELWVPPFAVERLLLGVNEAMAAAEVAADGAAVAQPVRSTPRLAVLAVVAAKGVREAARTEAAARGDALTTVADFAAAQALVDEASFDLLVVQAPTEPAPRPGGAAPANATAPWQACVDALTQYRASWGMGDVPCLWMLPAHATAPKHALPPRSAWLVHGAPWGEALAEAYASALAGQVRAFARYTVALTLGMRVGGEVREAVTVNVSRRGLLLKTNHLPSVGTELMLVCYLPNGATVQVRGKALRVALPAGAGGSPDGPSPLSQMGVALGPFVADGERVWLGWLKQLAAAEVDAQAQPRGGWVRRLLRRT